jgi:hypothetical protein
MGTEETKSTSDNTNSITENNVTTTQKVAYGEEKIKDDEEEEISSREKKPVDVSTTSAAPDIKIEEEKNVIVVANNPPLVPTSTKEDSDEIKIQRYQESPLIIKEDDEEPLSTKAHQAEESVLDVIDAVGAKVGSYAKEKLGDLEKSLNPNHMSAVEDSRKIEALGPMVEDLARVFEETTTIIRKVPYEEQIDLLIGYKKLIEEQIKVIDSRIDISKRLK